MNPFKNTSVLMPLNEENINRQCLLSLEKDKAFCEQKTKAFDLYKQKINESCDFNISNLDTLGDFMDSYYLQLEKSLNSIAQHLKKP